MVATRYQLLRLKCTKFNFAGALPQTPLGELAALPLPTSWIKGAYFQGRGREGEKGRG